MRFEGKRLLLAAKEAGAGSLLAALSAQWRPDSGSVVVASAVAAPYFYGSGLDVMSEDIGEDDIAALIAERRPEGAIVGCAVGVSVEKRVMIVSQAAGIVVDAFVDHYWNLWQRFADPRDARPWAFLPDRVHVPTLACAKRLTAAGYPQHRINVFEHPLLGCPFAPFDPELGRKRRKQLDIENNATVVMFVSEPLFVADPLWDWDQAHEDDYRALLATLLRLSAASNPEAPIIVLVRCHPAEPVTRWQALCEAVPGSRYRNAAGIAKDVIFSVTDIAFGLNSMLLLEATAAGIPAYSRHTIPTRKDQWLSTIRPEIVELADDLDIEKIVRSVAMARAQIESCSS